jgi:hypothetical protein
MDEYDPAYCIYCRTTTLIYPDTQCLVIFGVTYVRCSECGKSIPFNA